MAQMGSTPWGGSGSAPSGGGNAKKDDDDDDDEWAEEAPKPVAAAPVNTAAMKKQKEDLEKQKEEAKKAQWKADRLENEAVTKEKEVQEAKGAATGLQAQVETLSNTKAELEAEVARLKDELAREKETVAVTTSRLKEMEGGDGDGDGRDRANTSFLDLMQVNKKISAELDDLKRGMADANSSKSKYDTKMKALESQRMDSESLLDQYADADPEELRNALRGALHAKKQALGLVVKLVGKNKIMQHLGDGQDSGQALHDLVKDYKQGGGKSKGGSRRR
jgi:chromosome segregation ATPase